MVWCEYVKYGTMILTMVAILNFLFTVYMSKISSSNRPKNCQTILYKKNQNKNIAIGNFDYLVDFSDNLSDILSKCLSTQMKCFYRPFKRMGKARIHK